MSDLMKVESYCKLILKIASEKYDNNPEIMEAFANVLEQFYYDSDPYAGPECWNDVLAYFPDKIPHKKEITIINPKIGKIEF